MPHWLPTWHQSLAGSALLVALGLVLRRRRGGASSAAALAREAGVVLGLFTLWQLAGMHAERSTGAGLVRGEQLWDLERTLRMPSETAVQALVLPYPLVVQAANAYYVVAHYNTLLLTLLWLFLRHRDGYSRIRGVVVLSTFASLLLQLVAVAPPRLLPGHGIVDTALRYGQSVYGPATSGGLADQYAALPSVHVVWAGVVALAVLRHGSGGWRWLGVVHAMLTTAVVVVTGNHYWMDAVAGLAVLAVAVLVSDLLHRRASPLVAVPVRPSRALDVTVGMTRL